MVETAYQRALILAQEAGDASMRQAGRTEWNQEDAEAADREFQRLYDDWYQYEYSGEYDG